MKILMIRSNPVLPDSRVEKEANSLIKQGHTVDILAWDREKRYSLALQKLELSNGKINIYRVGHKAEYGAGKKNFFQLLLFQVDILLYLLRNNNKYDVVHACDLDTVFFPFLLKGKIFGKLVYDIFDFYADSHNIYGKIYSKIRNFELNVINKSDVTIICSEQRKEQIIGATPKKLVIIHNTPDYRLMHGYELRRNGDKTKIKIVYIGILGEGRMISELLEIVSENEDYELHIGGFGPLEREVGIFSEKNSNIFFYGKVSYSEALAIENECDIITALYDPNVKNHYYAAPNKFYEAIMLGKPVIMVKNTGMANIVDSNNIGIVIQNMSKDDLLIAIEKIKLDKVFWAKQKENIQNVYYRNYSWDIMEKRLIELYEGI